MGYEFSEVSQGYFGHNARLAEWIVALTIGELAFIISQQLFKLGFLFYAFLALSFISIVIAILIMYMIAVVEDANLHSVLTLANRESFPPRKDFDKSFDKRIGKVRSIIVNSLINFKAFQWLVFSFMLASILMIILVVRYFNLIHNYA